MRSKILIALAAAAIGMSSCEWFAFREQEAPLSRLQGKWQVDSTTLLPDSGIGVSWPATRFIKGSLKDSSLLIYNFSNKEIFATINGKPVDTASYVVTQYGIIIKSKVDTTQQVFEFEAVNDSSLSVTANDTTTLYLSRAK